MHSPNPEVSFLPPQFLALGAREADTWGRAGMHAHPLSRLLSAVLQGEHCFTIAHRPSYTFAAVVEGGKAAEKGRKAALFL